MSQVHRTIQMSLAALGLIATRAIPARAETPSVPFMDTFGAWDASSMPEESAWRSPTVAGSLSAGVTVGGVAVIVDGMARHDEQMVVLGAAAFVLGPSTGHWYSGEGWNAGLELRLGGALLAAGGAGVAFACDSRDRGSCGRGNDLAVAGAAVYVAGAVYEIATAPRAARDHDRDVSTRVAIAPIESPEGAVPGLILAGRF